MGVLGDPCRGWGADFGADLVGASIEVDSGWSAGNIPWSHSTAFGTTVFVLIVIVIAGYALALLAQGADPHWAPLPTPPSFR